MTVGSKIETCVGKVKELGRKGLGAVKAGGTRAKAFAGKHRAASIAAGVTGAAGAAGGAALASRNRNTTTDGKVYRKDAAGNMIPFEGKTNVGQAARAVAYNAALGQPVYAKQKDGTVIDVSKPSKAKK